MLSSEASDRTKRRRRDDIVKRRASISGGNEGAQIQLLLEVRTLKRDERQKLLVEAGINHLPSKQIWLFLGIDSGSLGSKQPLCVKGLTY